MAEAVDSRKVETELRAGQEYSEKLEKMMCKARDASDLLKALSHENRLILLCLLSEKERSVGELEEILSLRQAAVSQQLARLRFDGIVSSRREGKTVFYSISDSKVRSVISVLYDLFCDPKDD